jgi:hypothetical protein
MYEAPRLEKFGTFRDLTRQGLGKTIIGDDAVPGIGLDCNPNTTDPVLACRS